MKNEHQVPIGKEVWCAPISSKWQTEESLLCQESSRIPSKQLVYWLSYSSTSSCV